MELVILRLVFVHYHCFVLEFCEFCWDFISKNEIFGTFGIMLVLAFLRGHTRRDHQPGTHSELQCHNHENHRNSINSINSMLWNKISSAHHNSLHAMEFLESLDLPSLSRTLTIEGDRERPPPSHPYLNDRRRRRETATQPPLP